ncbi:uncharacterized protein L969DRAFT_95713 [Mixia osmundae IAM 14324]|uniref:Uncharacterized protein n=1 Tax=Mixia osmundae (strain CBS 9802 / IAM 14324 / JCM 22182 / KY 12970) TaxID=764103 RepID=G7DWN0_MIXOS|nr:uncharacterized protein L969DRAFT_95713 [Mixia osmundae IAM 14324]KEI37857.1 hypothetical protein L969DRAFT_95713 [Mixia osmundae IAM 14324]GAA94990.1 hypothetical protein E5Q_01645 [Mixia osmundae IAM 14324]
MSIGCERVRLHLWFAMLSSTVVITMRHVLIVAFPPTSSSRDLCMTFPRVDPTVDDRRQRRDRPFDSPSMTIILARLSFFTVSAVRRLKALALALTIAKIAVRAAPRVPETRNRCLGFETCIVSCVSPDGIVNAGYSSAPLVALTSLAYRPSPVSIAKCGSFGTLKIKQDPTIVSPRLICNVDGSSSSPSERKYRMEGLWSMPFADSGSFARKVARRQCDTRSEWRKQQYYILAVPLSTISQSILTS